MAMVIKWVPMLEQSKVMTLTKSVKVLKGTKALKDPNCI